MAAIGFLAKGRGCGYARIGAYRARIHMNKRGGGLRFRFFTRPARCPLWVSAIPQWTGFPFSTVRPGKPGRARCPMDKDSKEALMVAKELTAKFIETRTVSPGNFADVFPAVYRVVREAIRESAADAGKQGGAA